MPSSCLHIAIARMAPTVMGRIAYMMLCRAWSTYSATPTITPLGQMLGQMLANFRVDLDVGLVCEFICQKINKGCVRHQTSYRLTCLAKRYLKAPHFSVQPVEIFVMNYFLPYFLTSFWVCFCECNKKNPCRCYRTLHIFSQNASF